MVMWVLVLMVGVWLMTRLEGHEEYQSIIEIAHAEESMQMGEIISAEVTAYTASVEETDDRPREMASGDEVHEGAIACPSRYHFGTMVMIEGKQYICKDRMHKRFRDGNYFDVFTNNKEDAISYGRKQVIAIIYNEN